MAQATLDQMKFSLAQQSRSQLAQEQKDMETLLSAFTENIEDQQSQKFNQDYTAIDQQGQNFIQDDNVVPPKKREEIVTTVKQKLK